MEGGLCHRGVLVRAGVVERHGLGLQQVLVPAETGSVTSHVETEMDLLPQPDAGLGGTGVGGHAGRGLEATLAPLLLGGEGRLLQEQGPGQTRLRGLEGRGVDGGLEELRSRGRQGFRPVGIQG